MKIPTLKTGSLSLSLAAALCLPISVLAQDNANQHMDMGAKKMMTSSDMTFAMKAAQGGMAEVKIGQLAVDKASDPDVKAFGQRMIDDHTKANDQLKTIAANQNITLPTDLNAKDQSEYQKLSQLSGPAFDKAYMKGMVKDHETDVKEFQKEANGGKDPQLKEFASTTLPILQSHLQAAQTADAKVGK